jgi:peptide deformylase
VSNVRLAADPVLRKPCSEVDVSDIASIQEVLDAMYTTMVAENGRGLAANQIGLSIRIFILKDGDGYRPYINPEIISQEELVEFEGEGCLSIPGISANTNRYRKVKLLYLDTFATSQEVEFLDIDAFAVQHEMDHLNGKLYIDQFGPVKKNFLLAKHKKYLKEIRRQNV